jgi:hypothetical protein
MQLGAGEVMNNYPVLDKITVTSPRVRYNHHLQAQLGKKLSAPLYE